ncbi:MAG: Gfo/Idh/MocA family oxidoreductase [Bryobacteraceae bacterium]|nr:Gfo/Idh/MocA family oxidoreductase [Bryobacteraceae bacterium]
MNHSVLKGALIGCGFFGRIQAEAWSRIPDARIVAACDPDPGRARSISPNAFADAAEMLSRVELDFVDIATRPDSHLPLIRLAVERGLPVICQKPLADSHEDARTIAALAADSGILVTIHENWRWQPWFREAARLIHDGAIDTPICYQFRIRQRDGLGENAYPNQPYFREMPQLHIHETLVHPIDTARFFFGNISSVSARIRRLNPAIAGEDRALLLLTHQSQVDGTVDGHRFLDPDPPGPAMGETRIEGYGGVLQIDATGEIRRNGAVLYSPPQPAVGYKGDSARAVQMHFLDCIRGLTQPESSVDKYWNTFAAVQASYASAACGKAIAIA